MVDQSNRMRWQHWLAAALAVLLFTVPLLPQPTRAQEVEPAATHSPKLSDDLYAELRTAAAPVSFLVMLADQLDPNAVVAASITAADSGPGAGASDALARRQLLYRTLTAHARRTQASLRAELDAAGVRYRPFYIVNMVQVWGDLALAERLSRRPDVQKLERNPALPSLQVQESEHVAGLPAGWQILNVPNPAASMALPWGLQDTHADKVWALGSRGAGIVVASQDTGVKWDHPALTNSYRGQPPVKIYLPIIANNAPAASLASVPAAPAETQGSFHTYNWYDFYPNNRPATCDPDPQVPCDDEGHGTHTVGTMLGDGTSMGDTILGMAPAARWIGCRNMAYGIGEPASYAACFEFFLAPYPQGGDPLTDGRPELAPHIINNSWGCPTHEGCVDPNVLRQSVETVRAAGIFVAASAGNGGTNGCATTNDPISIYDATFTVGAYAEGGSVAGFSSRGPVNVDGSGRLKPDLSAPGVDVRSADLTPSGISWKQGTSMAAPHVAGAVALLWSAVPTLTNQVDLTEQILLKSATPVPDSGCTSGGVAASPNPTYGYGRLDVLNAVELARQPVTLTVTVALTDGTPAAATDVTLTDRQTQFLYSTQTDANGRARWSPAHSSRLLYAGSYDLSVAVGATCVVTITAPVEIQRGETKDLAVPTVCAAG